MEVSDAKRLRNAAARLRVTVEEMLAPASATPSPQRMKLDKALRAVEEACHAWDRSQALDRMQQLGQEADNGNGDNG